MPTFNGTSGPDLINGSETADRIFSVGGDDEVHGNGGDDTISGGSGNDTLFGDGDNDTIDGDDGNDLIHGGEGNDTVIGDAGRDILYGENGNDVLIAFNAFRHDETSAQFLYAGAGDDQLYGADGDDFLEPGTGTDYVFGYGGTDTISYRDATAGLDLNLFWGFSWDGTVRDGLSSIENAIGSSFNDVIGGTYGDNVIDGGAGGTDFLYGLDGSDTVSYASSLSGVAIDLDQQNSWDGTTMDFLNSFENATGSSFDDVILGSSGDNRLDGGVGGIDHLLGGGGSDTVSYLSASHGVEIYLDIQGTWDGANMDFLDSIENAEGSLLNDTLVGDDGANVLNGWNGNDTLIGGGGADIFKFTAGGVGHAVGNDRVLDFGNGADKISIDPSLGPIHSFADIPDHSFQEGNDTIIMLSADASIRLVGVERVSLTPDDFMFAS